jgi:Rad3-related DNA helicase
VGPRTVTARTLDLEDAVRQALSPAGPISRVLPGYQARPQQLMAAAAIARALKTDRTVLIEAPTGAGKSLSALVPLALHLASQERDRAVYSTATITLQEQLVRKDVPTVQQALGSPTAAVLKGMGRYLCLLKWTMYRDRFALLGGNDQILRFDQWVASTQTGDQAELISAPPWWGEVAADHSDCLGPACSSALACFALKARERARSAQLVISNHHILLAYTRFKSTAIPEDAAIVVDEAHRLADIAADILGNAFTSNTLPAIAQRIHGLVPSGNDPIHSHINRILALHERLLASVRIQPGQDAQKPSHDTTRAAAALAEAIRALMATIRARPWDVLKDRSGTSPNDRAAIALRMLENYLASLETLAQPPVGIASWIEPRQARGSVSLSFHAAPIDPGSGLAPVSWRP